jgi:hypothetical protein
MIFKNKTMRNILIRLSIGLIIFSVIYLLVSFVKLTLDFTQWSEISRFGFVLCGGIISFVLSIAPYETKDF